MKARKENSYAGCTHNLEKGREDREDSRNKQTRRQVLVPRIPNFQSAFWRSQVFDYKPYETWEEEGARDTQALATARVAKLLSEYQQPALDPAKYEALTDYVEAKKASMPDSFT